MNPEVWGKHGWFFLHSVTMGYPDQPTPNDADNYRAFFYMLPNILPCEVCRSHFADHLRTNNIERALTNKRTLVEWLVQVHNMTNRSLGKREMTYEQVIALYTDIYAGKKSVCNGIGGNGFIGGSSGSSSVWEGNVSVTTVAIIVVVALCVGAFSGNYLYSYFRQYIRG